MVLPIAVNEVHTRMYNNRYNFLNFLLIAGLCCPPQAHYSDSQVYKLLNSGTVHSRFIKFAFESPLNVHFYLVTLVTYLNILKITLLGSWSNGYDASFARAGIKDLA